MKKKEILEMLLKYSVPIGFGGWTFKATNDFDKKNVRDNLATIKLDMWLKEADLYLSNDFYKLDETVQKNIIIHELVHGRVLLKDIKLESIMKQEEELMVNDIVSCVEEAMR